ncbi:hypothetical protein JW887_02540 [Candidatus Dojkabacteria bacterium]|nr:hypothetical protein [Candidatus Dojkabacteria bacterium]
MDASQIKEFLNILLISFATSAILSPIIINILYNRGVIVRHILLKDKSNEEFIKHHKHKSGTPTMGGFIITIPFIVLSLIFIPNSPTRNVFLIGYSLFAFFGFLDEFIVKAVKANIFNENFRKFQESFVWRFGKVILIFIIGLVIAYLMNKMIGIKEIFITNSLKLPFSGIFLLFWAGLIIFGTYGAEITDGLDGLVTGLFLIAYLAFILIVNLSGNPELNKFIAIIIGASLVYLYFNITPARIFMGGVGAMPLGFGLTFLAIITNSVIPYLLITMVFWGELLSSAIQIISIRFFKKKVFKIAPLHHHFESIGWSEAKVVQRFWLAGVVGAVVGLWLFVV